MEQWRLIIKICEGLLALTALIGTSFAVLLLILCGPVAAYRMLLYREPDINTYTIFPQRLIDNAPPVSTLQKGSAVGFPEIVTFAYKGSRRTVRLADLLVATNTRAFIVIRDDTVLYERYLNGARRDSLNTSFSVAKSFMSSLIGIAIDEGKIKGANDPVIRYLPELKGRGLDSLTIRDMLTMSSGVPYEVFNDRTSWLKKPFSDDAKLYYSPNLRELALGVRHGEEPLNAYVRYNGYYMLLEGLILERVTHGTVSRYLQEKIWKPMGMEYPATWSLDSKADGFEKTDSGLNARAIDYARFGLLYLHRGQWNNQRIVPEKWVLKSTVPDPTDRRPWKVYVYWPESGGYYKYHWWGLKHSDGTYDYMASGLKGQEIYISPSRNIVIVRFGGEPDPNIQWSLVIRALIQSISRAK
jgi:CubicO group peptidase (beta-lactamase class C family)